MRLAKKAERAPEGTHSGLCLRVHTSLTGILGQLAKRRKRSADKVEREGQKNVIIEDEVKTEI